MHITQLNNNVLLEILTWLDIFDAINFFSTCKRMQILEDIYSKRFAKFDFRTIERHMSLVEINRVLHLVGKSLTKLDILTNIKTNFLNGTKIIKAVQKQCDNLQELNLTLPYFAVLKHALPDGLNSLSITGYELENDSIAEKYLIGSRHSLETFRMFDMMNLNGSFLDKFLNLQQLELENCKILNQENLVNCCRQNKTLRTLKILSCPQINENLLQEIGTVLPLLEVLHLDIFPKTKKIFCSPLNQLDNLKILHIALDDMYKKKLARIVHWRSGQAGAAKHTKLYENDETSQITI